MKALDKYIIESLIINEAFKSQVLRDIATYVKGHAKQYKADSNSLGKVFDGHGNDRLVFPRGIQWDKLTDDDIVFGFSNDDLIRNSKVVRDKDWIVLWIDSARLYTYMSCNGKAYKLNYSTNKTFYRKDYVDVMNNGDTTVFTGSAGLFDPSKGFYTKKEVNFDDELMTQYGAPMFVIAIPKKTILKLSTLNLIKSRYDARNGATAFLSDDVIRKKNLLRYETELAKIHAQNKNAKAYVSKLSRMITEYRTMQAEVNEVKQMVEGFRDSRITDILKGAGIDDEDYMEIFMGIGDIRKDSIYNGHTKLSASADWEFGHCLSTMRSAEKIIDDAMDSIQKINQKLKERPSEDELKEFFEGINFEFNKYQNNMTNYHKELTEEINKFKSYLI